MRISALRSRWMPERPTATRVADSVRHLLLPWWLLVLVFLLVAAGLALASAPASWVDRGLNQATAGRVRMAETAGSIWRGQGRLVLADPFAEQDAKTALASLTSGVPLPPLLSWTIEPWPLLIGRLQSQVRIEGLAKPVEIAGDYRSVRGSAGALELPTVTLDRLGSPWNTVQPRGKLSFRWEPFIIERGSFNGNAEMELANVSSALSPVKPLGHYRIRFAGQGSNAQISMTTVSGPLMLSGDGQWTARSGLRFAASAEASNDEKLRLQPLLGLIGRRDGDRVIIKIGA